VELETGGGKRHRKKFKGTKLAKKSYKEELIKKMSHRVRLWVFHAPVWGGVFFCCLERSKAEERGESKKKTNAR